jgi:hypothetical protein
MGRRPLLADVVSKWCGGLGISTMTSFGRFQQVAFAVGGSFVLGLLAF